MTNPIADVIQCGHAATRTQLRELGHSRAAIAAAIGHGGLTPIGRSWLAAPEASPNLILALQANGLVGGLAALRSYGIWVAEPPTPVVSLPRTRNLPDLPPHVLYCRGSGKTDARYRWRVPLTEALHQYALMSSEYSVVAAFDSALHLGMIDQQQWKALLEALPRRVRRWLQRCNRKAESGLETILRLACLDQGWQVEVQQPFSGGRLDLVVNGWLCVEADGSTSHDTPEQAKKDRKRNNALVARGLRWHRFSYDDVVHRLDASIETIRALLAHGKPPRPNRAAPARTKN